MRFIVLSEYVAEEPASRWALKSGLILVLMERIEGSGVGHRVQSVEGTVAEQDWLRARPEWELVSLV